MSAQRSANKVALNANSKITLLPGVGPKLAEKLAALGINSIKDLWFHFPLRYQDRTRITPIGALRPGQDAVIEGVVAGADIVMGRRRSLLVHKMNYFSYNIYYIINLCFIHRYIKW